MRIITIDNGNTNPHVGIFQNEKLDSVVALKDFMAQEDDFILLSDVGSPINFSANVDLKKYRRMQKGINHFFEMPVLYSETLGDDRLISSYLVFSHIKPNEKILLIDAGTFITIDLINDQGFLGGYIFPGIATFLSSYQKGSNLKILSPQFNLSRSELPHSTEEAILGATEIYLESVLKALIKKTSPSKIIITGGSFELVKNIILKFNLPKVQLETYHHLIHYALFLIYQNHLRPKSL
ncbi:MAG: type III pantothenate kinase [Bacteriovorax sp.]|nr:type III pantothenate kinase [Bacteriovorax sp.]